MLSDCTVDYSLFITLTVQPLVVKLTLTMQICTNTEIKINQAEQCSWIFAQGFVFDLFMNCFICAHHKHIFVFERVIT